MKNNHNFNKYAECKDQQTEREIIFPSGQNAYPKDETQGVVKETENAKPDRNVTE